MKRLLLLATFCLLAISASAQAPVISPSPAFVNQGGTINFTETLSQPGTWSCTATDSTGAGTTCAGSIVAGTGVYTAPASVTAKHMSGGFQLLPNNHVYNTRIDALPVNSNNAAWMAVVNVGGSPNWSVDFPFNYLNSSAAIDNMVFQYTTANNGSFLVPSFPNAIVEHGWFGARANANADHHVIMVNTQTGQFSELYQYYAIGLNGACLTCNSQSGIKYNYYDYGLPPISTDAAGMQLQPLILGIQEFEQAVASSGTVNHAFRNTFGAGLLCTCFIWPATTTATDGATVPFGARLRLKSSFNISSYSAAAQILLTALKNYGTFVTDGGNNWPMNAEYGRWPKLYYDALGEVSSIGATLANNMEFVDESGLQVAANQTCPVPSTCGLTTRNREIVTFTRTSDSATASVDVALQGVAVNLPQNYLYIQAGTPAQQLSAYVNIGTVTWTMSPSVGTLTAGGLFTPPGSANADGSTVTTITATSTTNAAVAAQMAVTVFPTGTIYAIPSKAANYTDSLSNIWIMRTGVNSVDNQGCCACDHSSSFGAITDVNLFNCQVGSSSVVGNDERMEFTVPNGTYTVTYNYGTESAIGVTRNNLSIQGALSLTNADFSSLAGGQYKPYTLVVPNVPVTGNTLSVVVWDVNGNGAPVSSIKLNRTGAFTGSATTLTPGMKVTSGVTIR